MEELEKPGLWIERYKKLKGKDLYDFMVSTL